MAVSCFIACRAGGCRPTSQQPPVPWGSFQAHGHRLPNHCPPLPPCFLPKPLSGSPDWRETRFCPLPLLGSPLCSRALITACILRTAMPGAWGARVSPGDAEHSPDHLAWLGLAWHVQAGAAGPHATTCSRLGVEVSNALLDATPGTGALGVPPLGAFWNHCPIIPGGAGTSVMQGVPSEPYLGSPAFPGPCWQGTRGTARAGSQRPTSLAQPAWPHLGDSAALGQQKGSVPGLAEMCAQPPSQESWHFWGPVYLEGRGDSVHKPSASTSESPSVPTLGESSRTPQVARRPQCPQRDLPQSFYSGSRSWRPQLRNGTPTGSRRWPCYCHQ